MVKPRSELPECLKNVKAQAAGALCGLVLAVPFVEGGAAFLAGASAKAAFSLDSSEAPAFEPIDYELHAAYLHEHGDDIQTVGDGHNALARDPADVPNMIAPTRGDATEPDAEVAKAFKAKQGVTIFLGPPACGKGSESARLMHLYCSYNVPFTHLSTGDMLRAAVAKGTTLGKEAKSYMDSGRLVPDEVIMGLIKEKLSVAKPNEAYLLDGFPRTMQQAQGLDNILKDIGQRLSSVYYFNAPEQLLVERATNRLIHPASGRIYNLKFKPPSVAGKDDATGEPLVQRDEDTAEVVVKRLGVYKKQTLPLVDYYKQKGKLTELFVRESGDNPAMTKEIMGPVLFDAYSRSKEN